MRCSEIFIENEATLAHPESNNFFSLKTFERRGPYTAQTIGIVVFFGDLLL